ncbi:hypothetical protein [Microvirga sp. CF3016]|uniref:hypothetical protein n=1 Tax=Microvirga sp. CF3016 TaxID=3110181 RepID=UPI002E75F3F2|nr:hypothetical protein [Microvirga sp. CF3016]MEE1611888.1 hypothetical protein [Microvirga sp. CF3016]
MPKRQPSTLTIAVVAAFLTSPALAGLTCNYNGKDSTAIVKNEKKFQKTCTFECEFNTETASTHINRGSSGLNPGESHSQKGISSANITGLKAKSNDCDP